MTNSSVSSYFSFPSLQSQKAIGIATVAMLSPIMVAYIGYSNGTGAKIADLTHGDSASLGANKAKALAALALGSLSISSVLIATAEFAARKFVQIQNRPSILVLCAICQAVFIGFSQVDSLIQAVRPGKLPSDEESPSRDEPPSAATSGQLPQDECKETPRRQTTPTSRQINTKALFVPVELAPQDTTRIEPGNAKGVDESSSESEDEFKTPPSTPNPNLNSSASGSDTE